MRPVKTHAVTGKNMAFGRDQALTGLQIGAADLRVRHIIGKLNCSEPVCQRSVNRAVVGFDFARQSVPGGDRRTRMTCP